jgi:chromosome segregation protein
MPLRLKSLELHGYKTFVAKTTFEFAEGITAIVGPNGSGKSNIADALRWVLGEQSYSLLRAKRTEDLIFAGSEQRPRAGMASVDVLFDNSTGWLPVDFSEVALARRAYRDGRNEYFLNSQHVRLREINELLAQSGLSERTYTILGQGLVDASLALKADERRRLFEEAAGIGLYRSRREESLPVMEQLPGQGVQFGRVQPQAHAALRGVRPRRDPGVAQVAEQTIGHWRAGEAELAHRSHVRRLEGRVMHEVVIERRHQIKIGDALGLDQLQCAP